MFNGGININLMEDELEEHEFQVNVDRVYHTRPNFLADMNENEFFFFYDHRQNFLIDRQKLCSYARNRTVASITMPLAIFL